MNPRLAFDAVWQRYDAISAMYSYLIANVAPILSPEELLRSEWVGRVSALDLFVHEIVAQLMLEQFKDVRPRSKAFLRFRVSFGTLSRIRAATDRTEAESAFDLEVRTQLSLLTFQSPDKIADGIRLISDVELWNAIAISNGATAAQANTEAIALKGSLAAIVDRRNKIAHEGDLGPTMPRIPNPISPSELVEVRSAILRIVNGIQAVI